MPSNHSVTCWLAQLKAGDSAAAQSLWERYFERLVHLARKRLAGTPRGMADEEDVALSAFNSFCLGVAAGRFPQLADRDDLWKVLVVLTARKVSALRAHEGRIKRGGTGAGERTQAQQIADADWERIVGPEPTPEFAFEVAEQYGDLLDSLGDEVLRVVAIRKMEGYTNQEIAGELGCNLRTVERKLFVIRSIWEGGPTPLSRSESPTSRLPLAWAASN